MSGAQTAFTHPHRHSQNAQGSSSPPLQNPRVAQILQATGHPNLSSASTNRFSSSAQNSSNNHFYASSAPSSSLALDQDRISRPPVPLFSQSTGSIPQTTAKMNLQDFGDFDDFVAMGTGANTAYSSPAIPTVFDLNDSTSSSANMGTVSPQDLLIKEPFMSAPGSTALTNLTSPSVYNESPEFNDNFDVSPNFGSSDFDTGSADPWFPLFPPGDNIVNQPAVHSPASKPEDLEVVERPSGHQRRKSGNSPPSGSGRHSSVSGVNSRRRDKPLPPIVVDDPSDTVAMKRARNTLAARKSRERKAQKFEELEDEISKLKAERDHWKKLALAKTG